jgi:very-short-patch-repair endonuclease
MQPLVRTVERVLARIAQRQHGLVTRAQLAEAGLSRQQIRSRLQSGSLLRVHRGVYRVGHKAPSTEATYLAAVLAAGEGAVSSGLAAAYVHELVKGPPPPPEVTAGNERRIEGVRVHRCRILDPRSCTIVRGIPVTSVPRTLVDIAANLSDNALARACHEAGVRYRTTPAQVEAELALRPNVPGARRLRRVIAGDVHVTLSAIERRFVELMRAERRVLPVTNRPAGGRRVDCRWPEQRLTVELDGYRFHNSRHSWEQDRRREREARARGDEFRRYTYGDVMEDPRFMLAELRVLLPLVDDPG